MCLFIGNTVSTFLYMCKYDCGLLFFFISDIIYIIIMLPKWNNLLLYDKLKTQTNNIWWKSEKLPRSDNLLCWESFNNVAFSPVIRVTKSLSLNYIKVETNAGGHCSNGQDNPAA